MRTIFLLLGLGVLATQAACVKHLPSEPAPLFRPGEDWVIRYREQNGAPCTLVLRVTDFVDPFLSGTRQSESCHTDESGTWIPDAPAERRLDITTLDAVQRLEDLEREQTPPSATNRFAASCVSGILSGLCTSAF